MAGRRGGAGRAGEGVIDSRDRKAVNGPWSAVVRRHDGAFARHQAVVTFPVDPPEGGRFVRVGGATGAVEGHTLTWALMGTRAEVRGDLSLAELIRIAEHTGMGDHAPYVRPPTGYLVVAREQARPVHVREVRYGAAQLPGAQALGGLVFTGVATGGDYEEFFTASGRRSGTVHGSPAVFSTALGSGVLGWEPCPGTVAFVGWSGAAPGPAAVAALHRLAAHARPLDRHQWRATHPQVIDQPNDLSY